MLRHLNFLLINNIKNKTNNLCTFAKNSKTFLVRKHCVKETKLNFNICCTTFQNTSLKTGYDNVSSGNFKKRPVRKKKSLEDDILKSGRYNVVAFATAEEYNLENLLKTLKNSNQYESKPFENSNEVINAIIKSPSSNSEEPKEIFFFRDGSVVFWNITESESSSILKFLKEFEEDSYPMRLIQAEGEVMKYKYSSESKISTVDKKGDFVLASKENLSLDKFAVSNAMMLSVKLGIWEAYLQKYIDEIEFLTENLKNGEKLKMSRKEVLKKHGELFALRHCLNLSSDVLDTPDFYWEHEELENLYNQICGYFSINKRTRVMNERINHCLELISLVSSHLNDKHSVRLEWMIIILITVEVIFEILHYVDRYKELAIKELNLNNRTLV